VKAAVRNPDKKPPKCSSVKGEARAARLFNRSVAESQPSPEEHLLNRPHEPRPSNPSRTIKRVRHKDVNRPVVRVEVNVGPKFTRVLVLMLNLQRATRDSEMLQRPLRLGGWELAKETRSHASWKTRTEEIG
jgi:hypothetical protein